MTTIRVTSRNAAGVAVPGARVVVRLVAGPRPTDPGYFTTGDYSITSESRTVTGSTGVKSLDLPPTDGFSPDGCFYQISTVIGADVAKRTIIVPDTGDYDWGDPTIQVITPVPPEYASGRAPVLAPLPGGERTVLTCTAGRPDVDVFVNNPDGLQGALDLRDPALCPGHRVAIVSGDGAVPLSVFWTIPDWPATLTWGADMFAAFGGLTDLDFSGAPFTVTFDDDGVTKTHTVDSDYPASFAGLNQLMTEMMTAVGCTYRQHFNSNAVSFVAVASSAATGTGAELTITSVTGGDPLDLASATPEDGWPGAVFAIDGTAGALDWEYSEYGVSDYRPPPAGDGIHTFPDDRSAHTRGVELIAVPASLNGGFAKWSAVSWPVRSEDL
jgi:hypothetical protein